jgi:hypothetical protein
MTDRVRYAAFVALLTMPDPPGMHRRHVWTQPGDPRRHVTRFPAIAMAYVQRLLLDRAPFEPAAPARIAPRRRRPRRPVPLRAMKVV